MRGDVSSCILYRAANCLARCDIDSLRDISITMRDEAFEWDDKKAARNWRNHRISFEMAREAFNDSFAVVRVDEHHDDNEERLALLGMVNNHLLFVSVHPPRGTNSHHLSPESRTT